MILDMTRSAGALTFLRASLTPAEQEWPRFAPTLRAVRDVSMGELRTHPDLVERVVLIAPAREHVWILMGAPVLVTPRGAIYGFGFGMRILALRTGADPRGYGRVQTKTPPSTGGGVVVLSDDWISVDPWMTKVSKADGIAQLKALSSTALEFVDQ
jgi:hypothetical protein